MYNLVSFDFDGTLADSADWFFATLDDLSEEFGFHPVPPQERLLVRAMDPRQIMKHLEIPMWKLPKLVARMRDRSVVEHHRFQLFPQVDELFRSLRELGMAVAIVSSNSEEVVRSKLGPRCSAEVVHYECGSSLFGKATKLKALLRTTRVPADRALYIGDEIRDAEAARDAGMAFGAVTWGYATREVLLKASPTFVFDSFERLILELKESKRGTSRDSLPVAPAGYVQKV